MSVIWQACAVMLVSGFATGAFIVWWATRPTRIRTQADIDADRAAWLRDYQEWKEENHL